MNIAITIAVALIAAAAVALAAKNQWELLPQIVFELVTKAEAALGTDTGKRKLAAVIAQLQPYIPALLRPFATPTRIVALVESVLIEAKRAWRANPKLLLAQ